MLAVPLANLLRLLKELDGLEQQIVEVECVRVLERLRIELVDLGDLLLTRIPRGVAEDRRAFHAVLRVADSRERRPRLRDAVVNAERFECLLDDRELIGGIVDDEVARQPDVRRLTTQQSCAQRVKRRDPHLTAVHTQQGFDAPPHFFRGFVGKGDGEDPIRLRQTPR